MLLGQHRAHDADDRVAVREDPDHVGPPLQLAVEPLLRVVRADLSPVLLREAREGEQIRPRVAQELSSGRPARFELLDDTRMLRAGQLRIGLRSPRATRPRRNASQPARASVVTTSTPRISRLPSAFTPTAISTATFTIRPSSRQRTIVA